MNRRRFLSIAPVAALGVAAVPLPEKAHCGCLILLPETSHYDLPNPALNVWTDVPLSGFSVPLPNCRLVLASLYVFGTSSTGDGVQVAAANLDTNPQNIAQIIDAAFSGNTVASIGLVYLPVLADHLRLYFNTDPPSPLYQALIRVVGYVP